MIYVPMKDSEIIKALEWCSDLRLCVDCPMRAEGYFSHSGNACRQALMKNALNLIIRQTADIEALKDSNEHLAVLLMEAKTEVAREIFEEIEALLAQYTFEDNYGYYISTGVTDEFAELKKKYTEEKK